MEECDELVCEIGRLAHKLQLKDLKLQEAVKGLEWLKNFVKDPLVKEVVETTLLKIK